MIAAPPPVAISVNGRSVGAIGVRWRGKNPGEMCARCGRVWLLRGGVCSHCQAREKALKNPAREVEIYADIERIYATKGRRSAAPDEPFVHTFRHAAAFGRADGTVILRGRGGRRLWDYFRA
jgi:hypothetical protein